MLVHERLDAGIAWLRNAVSKVNLAVCIGNCITCHECHHGATLTDLPSEVCPHLLATRTWLGLRALSGCAAMNKRLCVIAALSTRPGLEERK